PKEILDNAGLQPAFKNILNEQFSAAAAPEPPKRVAAFAGNGFALVTWNPPVFTGVYPNEIFKRTMPTYTVTSSAGNTTTISMDEFNKNGYAKISGLTNDKEYTFTVTASDGVNTSVPSLPSEPVTPTAKPITVPSAPTNAVALPGDGIVSIHFASPR